MKSRSNTSIALVIGLFLLACALGASLQPRQSESLVPRARWDDATPLGGKGLRLLLGRLGYSVQRVNTHLAKMPPAARVWLMLDPETKFSRREAVQLLSWVKAGGTFVWAMPPKSPTLSFTGSTRASAALKYLHDELAVSTQHNSGSWQYDPLPELTPLNEAAASVYWSGVKQAEASDNLLEVKGAHLEIAGNPVGTQLARLDYGRGRIIIAPDALMFTSYALSKPDTAILVTNLIRAHEPSGTVYFDERAHGETVASKITPSLLYYLWRPPLRYALLQMMGVALLVWALYGRRLGSPVPLPEAEPVTRASHFAAAMGALFFKAQRPRAVATILGEEFRRNLTRRLGMSIHDPEAEIAARAAAATDLPVAMIERLLLHARAPLDHDNEILSDAQEMELVLRRLNQR